MYACIVAHRLLYWTERQSDGRGRLMQCRMDGSNLRTVFRHRRRPRSVSSSCSCPVEFSVAPSFAVDHTRPVILYVADSDSGDIWSADEHGCHCQLIVNATGLSLTPSDIGQYTQIELLQLCNTSYRAYCHQSPDSILGYHIIFFLRVSSEHNWSKAVCLCVCVLTRVTQIITAHRHL